MAMPTGKQTILGVQMLFVAFGALVLVPLLTGLDPSIALFTAGIGRVAVEDRVCRSNVCIALHTNTATGTCTVAAERAVSHSRTGVI